MNADAGLAGEAINAMNVYHTLAASTELVKLRGNATVSKDGADFSAIKVLLQYIKPIIISSAFSFRSSFFSSNSPVLTMRGNKSPSSGLIHAKSTVFLVFSSKSIQSGPKPCIT